MKNNQYPIWAWLTNCPNMPKWLVSTALLFSLTLLNAQIQKGTTSLESSMTMAWTYTSSIGVNTDFVFSLTPTYARFLNKSVRAQITPFFQTENDGYSKTTKWGMGTELRYYFNPESKWQFFASASSNASKNVISVTYDSLHLKGDWLESHAGLSIGVNKFLNNEIAVEMAVKGDFLMTKWNQNLAKSTYSFHLNLVDFINFSSKINGTDDLIGHSRKIISGHYTFLKSVGSPSYVNTYNLLNAEFGRFMARGLLMGSKVNVHFYNSKELIFYMQYFTPISKRLMTQIRLEVGYGSTSKYWTDASPFIYNPSIGMAYFVSKNVAVNLDVFNYRFQAGRQSITPNARLLLFLK